MKLSQQGLLTTLGQSVVELKFIRRRQKLGWQPYRRALVSNDMTLLKSAPGQLALHYKAPSHPPPYPWIMYNLVCCWDIFWQDWRMVPVESCDVITVFPTQGKENVDLFWGYFNQFLQNMAPQDKIAFMNR